MRGGDDAHEHLLKQVVPVGRVDTAAAQVGVHGRTIPSDKLREGIVVAVPGPHEERNLFPSRL